MNQPSEEARYLASWLSLHSDEYQVVHLAVSKGEIILINEEKLAECIQQYFNTRQ